MVYKKGEPPSKHKEGCKCFRCSHIVWNKGRHNYNLPKTQKDKISESLKLAYKEKRRKPQKDVWNSDARKKQSDRLKEFYKDNIIWNKGISNSKLSETKKRLFAEGKIKPTRYWEGKNLSKNTKEKISEKLKSLHKEGKLKSCFTKERWQDIDFRESIVKNILKTSVQKPNGMEVTVNNIIQRNLPNEYKLNVLGDTILNGKVPDWINCNGQKKVILFNGIRWHLWKFQKNEPNITKEIVEERERKPYSELGFKVLHIWEDELKDTTSIIDKIKIFNGV